MVTMERAAAGVIFTSIYNTASLIYNTFVGLKTIESKKIKNNMQKMQLGGPV